MPAPRSRTPRRSRMEELWRSDLPLSRWPMWTLLVFVSVGYRLILLARAAYWRLFARPPGVMTIAVGNLTVGGNGKTPFTLFVAQTLAEHGLSVGIVSRGYRGTRRGARALLAANHGAALVSLEEAGDEALMMARSFNGPIAVARRRLDGIRLLQNLGPLDAVVLDDAFQHLRLGRDVNLLLVNAERGFGNGWMLPAGPMREPLSAMRRAGAVVLISSGAGLPSALSRRQKKKLNRKETLRAVLRPRALIHAERGQWRESPPSLAGRRVLAVCGLADGAGFYAMLRDIDADLVGVLEYPDHHLYSSADWQNIAAAARDADLIVTTEKDLVKLERFPFARDSLYALRLEVAMDAGRARLLELIGAGTHPPRRAAGG